MRATSNQQRRILSQAFYMRRILLAFALLLVVSLPATAQQLKLAFNEGRVSLEATNVPVRTILVEWGKLGGTKVIGAERIAGSPLTLKLENVAEAQALEIVLRSVAGYMAAPRRVAAGASASTYDRILVMATSTTPPPVTRPAPTQGNGASNGNPPRFVPPRQPARQVDQDEEPPDEPDQNPPNVPVFTFPQPGQQNGQPAIFQGVPPGANGQPVITINPYNGAPQGISVTPPPTPAGVPVFGAPAPGTSAPGMIVAPPPQPGQPGVVVRPPGPGGV